MVKSLKKKQEQPDDQTGCKQDNGLARFSNTLNFKVKLKVGTPEKLIIIPDCRGKTVLGMYGTSILNQEVSLLTVGCFQQTVWVIILPSTLCPFSK